MFRVCEMLQARQLFLRYGNPKASGEYFFYRDFKHFKSKYILDNHLKQPEAVYHRGLVRGFRDY